MATFDPGTLTGKTIKGYEIRELLGTGGFGAVFQAYQPSVGREVAIKIILPEFANKPDFIRRFEAEVQLVARLEHFHIVPLYDYWREPDGAYFVMRLLRGGSVRELIKAGPIEKRHLLRILDQVAAALAVAHRNRVVHRDLKPDNIMLDREGNAYLADFGIAKIVGGDEAVDQTAANPQMVGSPAYSSPEQIRALDVTPLSDVYSLGIVLYEMLTGAHPFKGATISTMLMKHISESIPAISEVDENVPPEVDIVLAKATAKKPENRYENVQTLSQQFREALSAYDVFDTAIGPRGRNETVDFTTTQHPVNTLDIPMDWAEVENPFKGLRAFEEADSDDFFGREALVDALLEQFGDIDQRFMAVVGPSGSGKSSAVKAGMIPRLREGAIPGSKNWFFVEMFPGAYPLEELEAALLRVSSKRVDGLLETLHADQSGLLRAADAILPDDNATELLLFIDQFEEVFTFVEHEADRQHLLDVLLWAATAPRSRIRVIVTLRADFYDRPLLYPRFGELFRENTQVVLPMTDAELTRAITGPAERVDLTLESGLVRLIVEDVSSQPGTLPLLQYALTELFERRDGRRLTIDAYQQIGGVTGALARRADELYIRLDNLGRESAQQMFLRLVTLGEGTEDTRRRVFKSELISLSGDDAAMEQVIDRFSRYRLLTLDRDPFTRLPTVEIAHEALIRQWARLREWLNTYREDLRMQRRIFAAAMDWRKFQYDDSYLASGAQLDMLEEWAGGAVLQLTELESSYLNASIDQRELQLAQKTAQDAREAALEQRSRDRLRNFVIVLVVALVAVSAVSVLALGQRNIARRNALLAADAAQESQSLALAANAQLALLEDNTDLAVRLVLESVRASEVPPALAQNMLFEVAYAPGTSHRLTGLAEVSAIAALDEETVWVATDDGALTRWRTEDESQEQLLSPADVPVTALVAVGTGVVAGYRDGTAALLDAQTAATIRQFEVVDFGRGSVSSAAAVDDVVLLGLQSGQVGWFDVETGTELRRLGASHAGEVTALVPAGDLLLTSSVDRTVRQWDLATGLELARYEEHAAPVRALALSPDGTQFASGAQDGEIVIRSVADGAELARYSVRGTSVWGLSYATDTLLASSGADGVVRLWDLALGEEIRQFVGHNTSVLEMTSSPRPGVVLTGTAGGEVRLWNMTGDLVVSELEDAGSTGAGVFDVTVAGDTLLTGGAFGSLMQVTTTTGEIIQTAQPINTSFLKVVYNPADSGQFATAALNGSIGLWDAATLEENTRLGGHSGAVQALVYSPDGSRLVSSGRDETVRLWDTTTGEEIRQLIEVNATALAHFPDDEAVLIGTAEGHIIALNTETGAEPLRVDGAHAGAVLSLAFNADGSLFASGGQDNAAAIWERAMGEQQHLLVGHGDRVLDLAFAPNGTGLVTASGNPFGVSEDISLRLWDVVTGQELRRFGSEHNAAIQAISFSPDGNRLFSADANSGVIEWRNPTLPDLITYTSDHRYGRALTCREQAQFGLPTGEDCS